MRWMKLEPIIQSEVSQKEKKKKKHQYSILTHIYIWNLGEGTKMAEEYNGETTFSPTNSSKEHLNAEQTPQNNF